MAEGQSPTVPLPGATETAPGANGTGTPRAGATTPQPDTYSALDWRQGLSEQLRGDPQYNKTLEVYPDQNTFVRDAINWRRDAAQSVRLPAADAAPEVWTDFYQKLPGWVETPNAYTDAITLPPLQAEGEEITHDWDPRLLQDVYATAHANGILPRQIQPLLDVYARHFQQARHVQEADEANVLHEQELELQRRFGANVRSEVGKARQFFQRLTHDTTLGLKVWELLDRSGLGNHPDLVQWAALAGERWGEPPDLLSDGLYPLGAATHEEVGRDREQYAKQALDDTLPMDQRMAARDKLRQLERYATSGGRRR